MPGRDATPLQSTRCGGGFGQVELASGWAVEAVSGAGALFGANGLRFGADGRLYVAQAFGSQVSAIEPATGRLHVVVPPDGGIVAPDDLAFDTRGIMYATEVFSGRVSSRTARGTVEVRAGDLPVANGITVHQDRLFVDEFRIGGRILELDPGGRTPRVIARDLPLPNALAAGPDGYLYFPLVLRGEVARVRIEGGGLEVFASGLDLPTAVKLDGQGRLVVVQAGSGDIIRFDLRSRRATAVARVRPGIDNLAFSPEGALYVSHFTDGGVARIEEDGGETPIVARGMLGPFGIAEGPDGRFYVADGMSYAVLSRDGDVQRPSMLLQHGFPGYVRGIAVSARGDIYLSNSAGDIALLVPGRDVERLATGLEHVTGLAVAPDSAVVACESGAGRLLSIRKGDAPRVLARGLRGPTAVAAHDDGSYLVTESGAGRVVHWQHGEVRERLSGLQEPHGVAVRGDHAYVVDRAARSLHVLSLSSGSSRVIARGLPVGDPPGVRRPVLPGIPGIMPGPLLPFTGLAAACDGSLVLSGDGDGSVRRLRPETP
jgi:sugar lactone lactonase YvrE